VVKKRYAIILSLGEVTVMKKEEIFTTISAISDPGVVRTNNEDSFLLADLVKGKSLADSCRIKRQIAENFLLLVVSDGVGGSQLGELASELTVLSIKDALTNLSREIPIKDRLVVAVEQANHLVWTENVKISQNELKPSQGMKATVTAVVIEKDKAYIATIGDSRAYLIRDGLIKQLTTDQTITGLLVSQGILSAEDVGNSPRSNIILQAIGNAPALQVAISSIDLENGDYLLLCSDGLSNKISDKEMCQMVTYYSDIDLARSQMLELAKQRGGEDNITIVLAKIESDALPSKSGKRITNELQQLSTFDPYAETRKSQKRTGLLGNRLDRTVGTRYPIEVRSVNTDTGDFVEQSETLQLSKMDASFLLPREVHIDDLLHISLPMPRELRMFDLDEPLYRLYAQVRKISRQDSGNFLVRVAFISKENPEGH
jgi:PPM family protein phosphatase